MVPFFKFQMGGVNSSKRSMWCYWFLLYYPFTVLYYHNKIIVNIICFDNFYGDIFDKKTVKYEAIPPDFPQLSSIARFFQGSHKTRADCWRMENQPDYTFRMWWRGANSKLSRAGYWGMLSEEWYARVREWCPILLIRYGKTYWFLCCLRRVRYDRISRVYKDNTSVSFISSVQAT